MVAARFTTSRAGTDRPATAQAGLVLALPKLSWHGGMMEQQPCQSSRAGGAIIAFTIIAGAVIGNHFGQASVGVVGGIALGVLAAVGLYMVDRRRG